MPVGAFPKRLHKSNPHRLQYPPAPRVVNILRSPNGIEDLLGEWGDLLTSLQVRSLEHNEIRIVGERAAKAKESPVLQASIIWQARHFPLILTLPLVALNPYRCRDQLRNCDTPIQRIQFLETIISAGADSSAPFFVTIPNNQKRHRC
jgi:hypothetical protein